MVSHTKDEGNQASHGAKPKVCLLQSPRSLDAVNKAARTQGHALLCSREPGGDDPKAVFPPDRDYRDPGLAWAEGDRTEAFFVQLSSATFTNTTVSFSMLLHFLPPKCGLAMVHIDFAINGSNWVIMG